MRIIKPGKERANEIKAFMFSIIKNDFGYEFNPDWHWDIEKLVETYLNPTAILLIAEHKGEIMGTIAGRAYDRDYPQLKDKYTKEDTLGIWRHYIKKDMRGRGIGTALLKKFEDQAKLKGYKKLYLHTQRTIPGSLEYWLAKEYKIILSTNDDLQTVHMEKNLPLSKV